jgi:transcriptional regulator with XRE-family HTH domain
MQHVGLIVRAKRLERGWTQAALHFHSRVSLSDISKIETGRLTPTNGQLQRLAAVLGPLEQVADDQGHAA